jgi:hypothetical protein
MNEFRPVIDGQSSLRSPFETTFRCQKNLISYPVDTLTDEPLVVTILIYGGCVQVGNPDRDSAAHCRSRFRIVPFAIPSDQAHAAEPDRRNFLAGISELSFLQFCILMKKRSETYIQPERAKAVNSCFQ